MFSYRVPNPHRWLIHCRQYWDHHLLPPHRFTCGWPRSSRQAPSMIPLPEACWLLPLGIEPGSLMTGSKRVDQWNCVWMQRDCRLSTGLPPSSRWLWSRKEDLQRAWNRDRRVVWDQVGLSHCWHNGLVTSKSKKNKNIFLIVKILYMQKWLKLTSKNFDVQE